MKFIQRENCKKTRFFLYKSHSGIEDFSICGVRNRIVEKGKHNCIDKDGNPISHECLSFGSLKAVIRYIRKNIDTINGEGRYLSPVTSIVVCKETEYNRIGRPMVIWFSDKVAYDAKFKKLRHSVMYKKRLRMPYHHKYAEGCFVRNPTQELIKALDDMGRWFERPWVPKNLEDCTLIASVNGGYWLTAYNVEANENLFDCEDNHKKFLKRARLLNTVEYRLKKSMKAYSEYKQKK